MQLRCGRKNNKLIELRRLKKRCKFAHSYIYFISYPFPLNSQTEENYLKAIYKITERDNRHAGTNAIAAAMHTAAASVTDMIKKLANKQFIHYEKNKGVILTEDGLQLARKMVRKHRLWETFLYEKLHFAWDEVHDIAEQLEHIQSDELVERLDTLLGHPRFDPHGDPIPDAQGNFTARPQVLLSEMNVGESGILVGVKEDSSIFLKYLDKICLNLGTIVEIAECFEYDGSMRIRINHQTEQIISPKVSQNLFIKRKT